jgi:hypothetical protein
MHVVLNLVYRNIGLSRLEKNRRGRKNIKRSFRDMGGDVGDYIVLKLFQ